VNITRSYVLKQREWRTWCGTPRVALDGTLFTWPDGELVTPNKLAAWLKEDILLRYIKVPKKRRSRGDGYTDPLLPADEQAALREAETLAVTLVVSVTKAA